MDGKWCPFPAEKLPKTPAKLFLRKVLKWALKGGLPPARQSLLPTAELIEPLKRSRRGRPAPKISKRRDGQNPALDSGKLLACGHQQPPCLA